MSEQNDKFEYTYSAPTEEQRREINSIRKYYSPSEDGDDKFKRLKLLDSRVKNTSLAVALCFGIIGTLIFGLGITLALEWGNLFAGIIVSIIGIVPMILAYPIYKYVLKHNKGKYANEILSLTEELLNGIDDKSGR